MFRSELITAKQASIEKYGSDYSLDPDETLVKLTLNADMARFDSSSSHITSIASTELDFNLDWNLFEDINYKEGTVKYVVDQVYSGSLFMDLSKNNKNKTDRNF